MNQHWRGQSITYHEEPSFWAQSIYYRGKIPSGEDLRFK